MYWKQKLITNYKTIQIVVINNSVNSKYFNLFFSLSNRKKGSCFLETSTRTSRWSPYTPCPWITWLSRKTLKTSDELSVNYSRKSVYKRWPETYDGLNVEIIFNVLVKLLTKRRGTNCDNCLRDKDSTFRPERVHIVICYYLLHNVITHCDHSGRTSWKFKHNISYKTPLGKSIKHFFFVL